MKATEQTDPCVVRTISYGMMCDIANDFMRRRSPAPDDAVDIGRYNDERRLLRQFIDAIFETK